MKESALPGALSLPRRADGLSLGAALFAVLAGQTRRDNERTVANLGARVTALAGRTIRAGRGA